MGEGCTVTLSGPWTDTKNDRNARKIRLNSCLLTLHKTEIFFICIIEFLAPKNSCIDINIVTLTALELMAQNVISKFQWRPF